MAAAMLSTATAQADVRAIVRLAQVVDTKSRLTSDPKCTLLRFVLQKTITTAVRSYLDEVVSKARASNPPPMLPRTISVGLDAPLQRTTSFVDEPEWDESDVSMSDAIACDWQTAPATTTAAPATAIANPMDQDQDQDFDQDQAHERHDEPLPTGTPVPALVSVSAAPAAAAVAIQQLPSYFVPAGAPLPALPANATLAAPMLVDGKLCLVALPHGSQLPVAAPAAPAPAPAQQMMFSWINATGRKLQRRKSGSRSRSPSPTRSGEPYSINQHATPALVSVTA